MIFSIITVLKMAFSKFSRNKQISRRSRRKYKRRYRVGKITRNPFLNFLRYYRRVNRGRPVRKIVKEGAQMWKAMTERERSPYKNMAKKAPIRKKTNENNEKYRKIVK